MSPPKMYVLMSSDNETFEVEESVAVQSELIKDLIEFDCFEPAAIPLPNVSSKILAKVIDYCKRHVEDGASAVDSLKAFDAEFVKVDHATLFGLITAANYMNIRSLLDLTCQTAADMIKGMTPEELRTILNVTNDYTAEEEEEIRREHAWAFE